jgi:hypothetical protein
MWSAAASAGSEPDFPDSSSGIRRLPMRWILAYSFFLFLFLRLKLASRYEKYYSGVIPWSMDSDFGNYLQFIRQEARDRLNPFLASLREPLSDDFHPDAPVNWERALVKRKDKLIRALAEGSFIVYVIVLVDAIRGAYIHRPWGNIPRLTDVFLLVAGLPALFWLKKQSNVDGLTQGYLNGYMDGYSSAYLDAKAEDGKVRIAEES